MIFTKEQSDMLHEGFRKHDITKDGSLTKESKMPDEQKEAYQLLKGQTVDYMKDTLPDLGIKRSMGNFSGDHPVNLLMNADAKVIAAKSAEVMCDKQKTDAAVDYFFDMFGPLFETARNAYCRAHDKKLRDLTKEERRHINARVVRTVVGELLSAVFHGQRLKEIYDVTHTAPAHEDYPEQQNPDSINFFNKWTHSKTKLGALLSLDQEMEMGEIADENWDEKVLEVADKTPEEEELEYRQLREAFMKKLDDTELEIFLLREDGKTHAEIAKELGYETHSTVTKRLKKMRKKLEELILEND